MIKKNVLDTLPVLPRAEALVDSASQCASLPEQSSASRSASIPNTRGWKRTTSTSWTYDHASSLCKASFLPRCPIDASASLNRNLASRYALIKSGRRSCLRSRMVAVLVMLAWMVSYSIVS